MYSKNLQVDAEQHVYVTLLTFIFKYGLILQSDLLNGVVIKTYFAWLISLPASCVFYVTRQVCLKINLRYHTRTRENTRKI